MAETSEGRLEVDLDVVVSCSRFGLIRGKAVNLGLDGAYIRTDSRTLSLSSDVTVTFQVGRGRSAGFLEVAGKVRGHHEQGVDIEFSIPGERVGRQLKAFLRNHDDSAAAGSSEVRYA